MRRRLFGGGGVARPGGSGTAVLAPMVDLLTLLLVAVLRTWSADPPVEVPEPGFQLPVSIEEAPPDHGVTIDVGATALYVEGWRAGSSTYWADADEVLIDDVYRVLQQRGGEVAVIRAHKETPWRLVGKVLFTAQQAGYGDIELVAVSRASL